MFWQYICLSSLCISTSDESKQKQQRQELEQSWMEVQQAVAGREKAEQSLQQIQAQLEETKVNLEELRSEQLIQQERSERGEAAATLSFMAVFQPWLIQGKQNEHCCSFSQMPFITVSHIHAWDQSATPLCSVASVEQLGIKWHAEEHLDCSCWERVSPEGIYLAV